MRGPGTDIHSSWWLWKAPDMLKKMDSTMLWDLLAYCAVKRSIAGRQAVLSWMVRSAEEWISVPVTQWW